MCVWLPPDVWRRVCASGLRSSVFGCVLWPMVVLLLNTFCFFIMHNRRDCAKSVSASINDLNMRHSRLLALGSVLGCEVPVLALV